MGQFVRFRNFDIHYTDQGAGEPVLLIHGYLETLQVWNSFAEKLSEKYRVICVDLPGHGGSGLPEQAQTMESMAEAVKALLEVLSVKKAFVTGHSLGGYIALAFADLFPEMLTGYCLFHSHSLADTEETLNKREKEIMLASEGRRDDFIPVNIKRMYADINHAKCTIELQTSIKIAYSIPDETIIAALRAMMIRSSRVSVLESGKIPCLWILGALDNYINCDLAQKMVRLPSNASLAILKRSGHMGFIEEERESLQIMDSFIKGVS